MSNNVALITGGAKGIGRAIALDLAAQQWSVAICYRTSVAAADETGKAIVARGGQALVLQCDVSDPEAAKRLVSQVERKWGRIDALINGAGPYHRVNLFDETTAGWREMFDGNLHPIFYLTHQQAGAEGAVGVLDASGGVDHVAHRRGDARLTAPQRAHHRRPVVH